MRAEKSRFWARGRGSGPGDAVPLGSGADGRGPPGSVSLAAAGGGARLGLVPQAHGEICGSTPGTMRAGGAGVNDPDSRNRGPSLGAGTEVAAVVDRRAASLLYCAGLRLLECARMGTKDVDFERLELVARGGKGRRDRVTMLPQRLVEPLRQHLERVRAQQVADLSVGAQ